VRQALFHSSDMDRITLRLPSGRPEDTELPFRLLVLGDFTGRKHQGLEPDTKPLSVNRDNFDEVLATKGIQLDFVVDNLFAGDGSPPLTINLAIRSMRDFAPDTILGRVPELEKMHRFRKDIALRHRKGAGDQRAASALDPDHRSFLACLGLDPDCVPLDHPDRIRAEIDFRLAEQIDSILHHPEFRRLEASWRALRFLIDRLDPGENCSVSLVSIAKEELLEDFTGWDDIKKSFLYTVAYTDELGQFGGKPYGAMIADYEFGPEADDVRLLGIIADVASMCHAPFIGAAKPSFFSVDEFSELSTVNVAKDSEPDRLPPVWRSLRKSEKARYIGLTLPGFLLRTPYDFPGGTDTLMPYKETALGLWGNPSFAFAACLLQSFARHRWCLDITGQQGGAVTGPGLVHDTVWGKDSPLMPTQVFITQTMEVGLAKAGFIPLSYDRAGNTMIFHSAGSVKDAGIGDRNPDRSEMDDFLAAQLPYTLVISRLAHYLKVLHRDNVGMFRKVPQLEHQLNTWLAEHISDMNNPVPEVKARRPLRRAAVKLEKAEGWEQQYSMRLMVMPHLKYRGADFTLYLNGVLENRT